MNHAGSVAEVEEQIEAEGVEIIWVIEEISFGTSGEVVHCPEFTDLIGSDRGWCVGDGQTMPTASAFDDSPLSDDRGFDILVERESMVVVLETSHGSTNGNANLTGAELLEQIRVFSQAGN